MNPVSSATEANARKYTSLVLRALASAGQRPVAEAIGCHESTVSRMKSDGEIERFCQLLAALGLKVVPSAMRCFDPKDVEAILHQARCWLRHVESAEQLVFEDQE